MLDWTTEYARERTAFGQPIGTFQNSRFRIAEMATEITIAEAFVDRCVDALNAGELTAEEAAMANARITSIYGGTTEIMKEIIGRSMGF